VCGAVSIRQNVTKKCPCILQKSTWTNIGWSSEGGNTECWRSWNVVDLVFIWRREVFFFVLSPSTMRNIMSASPPLCNIKVRRTFPNFFLPWTKEWTKKERKKKRIRKHTELVEKETHFVMQLCRLEETEYIFQKLIFY
jgi:hypothetical protein